MDRYPILIDGEEIGGPEIFEDLDPATGQVQAEVARGGRAEIDAAVGAARQALEHGWRRTGPADRARILRRIAELIRRDREQLADTESRDTGKPLRQARS